jgi:tetratricopeptide (TPR) repeat protein
MRICVEVKDNQRLQPLRLLVDFLRVWYDDQDLKLRLDTLKPASTSFSYLQSAIQKNRTDGNLRKQILLDHLQLSLPEETRSVVREGMVNGLKNAPEELLLALQSMSEKIPADAVLSLNEAIAEEASPATKVGLLLVRAIIHSELEDRAKEIADYTAVIDLPGAPAKHVAKALLNRGLTHFQGGDYQHAVADYTAVIDLPGASVEQVTDALFGRGLTHLDNGRKDESMADFATLISHPEAPLETVVHAHLILSETHFSDGRWSEGFQSLEASLDRGAKAQPAYHGNPAGLIGVVFSAGLNPEGRRSKAAEFLRLYQKHQALPALGAAIIQHIGSIFRSGEPFPSSDNLEGWRSAWEQASEGVPDLRLSIRLLNTSIAFLRTGGKDRSILLNLASAERSIVDQAFGPNGEPR